MVEIREISFSQILETQDALNLEFNEIDDKNSLITKLKFYQFYNLIVLKTKEPEKIYDLLKNQYFSNKILIYKEKEERPEKKTFFRDWNVWEWYYATISKNIVPKKYEKILNFLKYDPSCFDE